MSNTRLRLRHDDFEWREVEGEVVALDLRKLEYLAVNRSGAIIWPVLAEGATKEELVEHLTEAFDVEPDAAAKDVEAFLASLEEHDLLEHAET
jgi:DNA-binding GntR family transcriptional regulator